MRTRFVWIAVVLIGSLAGVARAGGNPADGKAKAVACAACHTAITGQSPAPHLVGQRETYLAKELHAFKSGDRKNPVMSAMANQLSDADIDNLAAYWAAQPANSDATSPPETAAAKKSQMAFPKDFPKGFVQYLSATDDKDGTVSKSYITQAGLAAVKAGKPLPAGTVIVVEADGKDGKIQHYAGMEIHAGWGAAVPELLRNGDWNYGVFMPDKTPKADLNQAQCLACHKAQVATQYVFLFKDIQAKASGK